MSVDSSGGASRKPRGTATIALTTIRGDRLRAPASTASQAPNSATSSQPKSFQFVRSPRPVNGPASQSGNERTPPGTRNDGPEAASNTSTTEAVSSTAPPATASILRRGGFAIVARIGANILPCVLCVLG